MKRFLFPIVAVVALIWLADQRPVLNSQQAPRVAYGILEAEEGSLPTASALFSANDSDGVLIWETGVPAVEPRSQGRIFFDQQGSARTGIAVVNVSEADIEADFVLRDAQGIEIARCVQVFAPMEHQALFIDELFAGRAIGTALGSLTFRTVSVDQRLAALALQQNINSHGDAIFSILPTLQLETSPDALFFPQAGSGPGFSTRFILVNVTQERVGGTIRLINPDCAGFSFPSQGIQESKIAYEIEAEGVFVHELEEEGQLQAGYAIVVPRDGDPVPSGLAQFRLQSAGAVVSEAGVAGAPLTPHIRFYVDQHRTRTGIAVASPNDSPSNLDFRLLDRNGHLIRSVSIEFGPGHHESRFADELFEGLSDDFIGQIEVIGQHPFVAVSLKQTINARGEPILTTLPVADLSRPSQAQRLVFPQLGFGEGLQTRLILVSDSLDSPTNALLSFFDSQSGAPLTVPLGDQTASVFGLRFPAGGSRGLRPGSNASVAQVSLDALDPQKSQLAVRKGESVWLTPQVIDSQGSPREDFRLFFLSLDPLTATVDEFGAVEGIEEGYSTITVGAGGMEQAATVAVVGVEEGLDGGGAITSAIQNRSGRVYMSDTVRHVILRADSLDAPPQVYAGSLGQNGMVDGGRLEARFDSPSFLALDLFSGDLYVSDSGNHAIRKISPSGQVATVALTGNASELLDDPQGLALDNQGRLWVADSENHVIRRIQLQEGSIETVAGRFREGGMADGKGSGALFHNPASIALDRAPLGSPGSESGILVADRGNGAVRRVSADGTVETLTGDGFQALPGRNANRQALTFSSLAGIAVNRNGFPYLSTGDSILEIQPQRVVQLLSAPGQESFTGIQLIQGGRFLVGRSDGIAGRLRLGSPIVNSIDPPAFSPGQMVTVHGRNLPDTSLVVIGVRRVPVLSSEFTNTVRFKAPPLDNGVTNLTVQHQGGIGQGRVAVGAPPPSELKVGEITTIAGGNTFRGDGADGASAQIHPNSVTLDALGNIFISEPFEHRVRRLDPLLGAENQTVITTVAGTGDVGPCEDGGPAVSTRVTSPRDVEFGNDGNLYIIDSVDRGKIRRIDSQTGNITTVAGGGSHPPFNLEGDILATDVHFSLPLRIAFDRRSAAQNTFYIVDPIARQVFRVAGETVSSFAGCGTCESASMSTMATDLDIVPIGVAVDSDGLVYFSDICSHTIKRVDPASGDLETFAGGDCPLQRNCGSPPAEAADPLCFNQPAGLAFDGQGRLHVADQKNHAVRRVLADGTIELVAGDLGVPGGTRDGALALEARLSDPTDVALDGSGNLFIAVDGNLQLVQVDSETQRIQVIAGNGLPMDLGDGRPATEAILASPEGLIEEANTDLLIADRGHERIRRVKRQSGIIDTVRTGIGLPHRMVQDASGAIFIATAFPHRVWRWVPQSGELDVVVGDEAGLNEARGVALDANGDLYVSDAMNGRILRKSGAQLTTIVGADPDSSSCALTCLDRPEDLALDGQGGLFIADSLHERVLRLDLESGTLERIAGDPGGQDFSDGADARSVHLGVPSGLAFDPQGDLYIAAEVPAIIYRIDLHGGQAFRVAGGGGSGDGLIGDGGPALQAVLGGPRELIFDRQGNLIIADTIGDRVRFVRLTSDPLLPE